MIEYEADGSYVTIDPLEGELQLVPDSAEWFEWLASVSSFHFVGTLGRFSARRGGSYPYHHRPVAASAAATANTISVSPSA